MKRMILNCFVLMAVVFSTGLIFNAKSMLDRLSSSKLALSNIEALTLGEQGAPMYNHYMSLFHSCYVPTQIVIIQSDDPDYIEGTIYDHTTSLELELIEKEVTFNVLSSGPYGQEIPCDPGFWGCVPYSCGR